MATSYDPRELGNFTHFEHVNFRVSDHYLATLFFIEGLGLTRDPMRMVSVRNMWVNVGQQQFHLPIGEPQPFAGEVGLTVADLGAVRQSLQRIAEPLRETEFAVAEDDTTLRVTSPWGHRFRLHPAGNQSLSGRLPQAIPYVTFWVPADTATGIAAFYRDVLGVPAQVRESGRSLQASVNVGVNQHFHFIEKRDLTLPQHPNHVAVYLTRYQAVYAELKRRDLLMEPDKNEQFRFARMIDPDSGAELFAFEHEMRSLHHPDFMKPLVNRVSVPYLID
jgi:hypothetical protein